MAQSLRADARSQEESMSAAPQPAPQPAPSPRKAFFTTLPGILTGLAGTLGTVLALVTALNEASWLRREKVTPTPTVVVAQGVISSAVPQAAAGQSAGSTTSNTPLAASAGMTLADDFSDATSGWQIQSEGDLWSVGYADGQYRVYTADSSYAIFGTPVKGYDAANLSIEVEAQQVSGPLDGMYGVIVREQQETDFYLFALASDGTFAVLRSVNEEWLTLFDWTESQVVKPLGEVNHLKVECVGATMRFTVNDALLAEVTDDALASGNVGLLAETTDEGAMEVRFDNVRVEPLQGF
jgi:hypothetical protein